MVKALSRNFTTNGHSGHFQVCSFFLLSVALLNLLTCEQLGGAIGLHHNLGKVSHILTSQVVALTCHSAPSLQR
jgi:hypothetical protein